MRFNSGFKGLRQPVETTKYSRISGFCDKLLNHSFIIFYFVLDAEKVVRVLEMPAPILRYTATVNATPSAPSTGTAARIRRISYRRP
jgi:hypothetical protein